MVGYALSASSDENYEDILITVIDADDFAFAGDGNDTAVYRYSRAGRIACRLDSDMSDNKEIPYELIYEISKYLRTEEIKWKFPVAIVWSKPEFGTLEILSVEFQKLWPAVMFYADDMEAPYVNITNAIFEKDVKPLYSSYFCDILNILLSSMGIFIGMGFYSCFNSVFCDIRILGAIKSTFKLKKSDLLTCIKDAKALRYHQNGKIKINRRRAKKLLKCFEQSFEYENNENDICSKLVNIKRRCVLRCVADVSDCLGKMICAVDMYDNVKKHIFFALEEITGFADELTDKFILNKRGDIYYMTFNDLISALTFADERMNLKSVMGIIRRKNAIAVKSRVPHMIMTNGKLMF